MRRVVIISFLPLQTLLTLLPQIHIILLVSLDLVNCRYCVTAEDIQRFSSESHSPHSSRNRRRRRYLNVGSNSEAVEDLDLDYLSLENKGYHSIRPSRVRRAAKPAPIKSGRSAPKKAPGKAVNAKEKTFAELFESYFYAFLTSNTTTTTPPPIKKGGRNVKGKPTPQVKWEPLSTTTPFPKIVKMGRHMHTHKGTETPKLPGGMEMTTISSLMNVTVTEVTTTTTPKSKDKSEKRHLFHHSVKHPNGTIIEVTAMGNETSALVDSTIELPVTETTTTSTTTTTTPKPKDKNKKPEKKVGAVAGLMHKIDKATDKLEEKSTQLGEKLEDTAIKLVTSVDGTVRRVVKLVKDVVGVGGGDKITTNTTTIIITGGPGTTTTNTTTATTSTGGGSWFDSFLTNSETTTAHP